MPKGKSYFSDLWLQEPKFHWVKKADIKTSCYCKVCKKAFELSNMGRAALINHQVGKRHKEFAARQNTLLKISSVFNEKDSDKDNFVEGNSASKKIL